MAVFPLTAAQAAYRQKAADLEAAAPHRLAVVSHRQVVALPRRQPAAVLSHLAAESHRRPEALRQPAVGLPPQVAASGRRGVGAAGRVGAPHPREQEGRPAESGGCEAPTLHPVSEPDAGTSSQRAIEIVRPLIDVARAEVLAFLEAAGQLWREDETNASDAFTRNRLRHEILPLVRDAVNPKADEALARLADQAAAAGNVLADALDAVWRQIVRETPAGAILIDADDFVPLRPWLQGAILRQAVERLGGGLKHMSAERTRAAVDALLARTVAGPVDLPGGLVAQRRRRVIRIGPRET